MAASAPPWTTDPPGGEPGRGARERVLRAALERFGREGALAATLEDVRRDAGVSVGALYHHFPDKAALAEAMYIEILAGFQDGFMAVLREHEDTEAAVRAGVRFHLRWVSENRDAAAFLTAAYGRGAPSSKPTGAALAERNRRFFAEVLAWWRERVARGELRSLPFDLIYALWLGPAQEYTRHWLAGRAQRVPGTVAGQLADAAWTTLREAP